ncbi:MAG: DUF6491 family protein [Amphiplicatus sp.]
MKGAMLASAIAISAVACATAAPRNDMSEEAAKKLAGFEPTGEKVNCLGLQRVDQIDPLSENMFLIRSGADDYYLNEVSGRCSGADSNFNRLQYKTSLSQLCRGEIITVVDNSSGFTVGSCGLGDFERLRRKAPEADGAEPQ